jgi:hypothetical protein
MRTGVVRGWVIAVVVSLIVIAVVVAGVVGLFGWAKSSGEELQKTFFAAVLSGDANRVTALMDPALAAEFDEPILEQWMALVKANLGEFRKLSGTDFHTSTNISSAGRITESTGTVEFEKGTASSELKFKDGKLIALNVKSDRIPESWFKGLPPDRTSLYRQRGEEFLTLFLAGKAEEAFGRMHESLQKIVPIEKLKAMMADTKARLGSMKSLEYQTQQVEPSGKLKIVYALSAEKGAQPVSVKFSFVGLKGHLVAFDFTGKED